MDIESIDASYKASEMFCFRTQLVFKTKHLRPLVQEGFECLEILGKSVIVLLDEAK